MFETVLSIVQVAICVVLIFLVLMHSGKDAGLSGAFGVGTGSGPLGGGSLVERNLNRWTVAFAVLFAINTVALLKVAGRARGLAGAREAPRARRGRDRAAGEPPAVVLG